MNELQMFGHRELVQIGLNAKQNEKLLACRALAGDYRDVKCGL
jgi:hypothetical protein